MFKMWVVGLERKGLPPRFSAGPDHPLHDGRPKPGVRVLGAAIEYGKGVSMGSGLEDPVAGPFVSTNLADSFDSHV